MPRTLSADHWRRLDDGLLLPRASKPWRRRRTPGSPELAEGPRVDWATLLRRTWAEDVLSCPKCRGRMALIEVVTDQAEIRRTRLRTSFGGQAFARLGLAYAPVSFAPPRDADDPPRPAPRPTSTRGPPIPAADLPDGADPSPTDDFRDPPWQEDCQIPADDDASQVPPHAEI